MKNLLLVAIALFTLNATAQNEKIKKSPTKKERINALKNQSPEDIATVKTEKLTEQLDLTEDQQKKVYAVLVEHTEKGQKNNIRRKEMITSEKKMSRAESKKEVMKQREVEMNAVNSKLKAILNAKQYEIYEQTVRKNRKPNQKIMMKKN